MKFSEAWLREWVDPPVGSDQLCEQLTMAGLEVDSVESAGPALAGIVAGRVTQLRAHPQAESLWLCQVDVGSSQPLDIVCGASDVPTLACVAVATVGSVLPSGVEISQTEIRGETSSGMLCSPAELGLHEDSAGLLTLDAQVAPGMALAEHLKLDDRVIEIDLTPNRGDCLSLRGVAREVGVWNRASVVAPEIEPWSADCDDQRAVDVESSSACPTYAGRVLTGLDPQARTPDWLREKLRRSGLRAHSPVVDVTNYVMLELGQPMHAFDDALLQGGIAVRNARPDEQLTLLDGGEIELDADTLVIVDASGPIALAGVMGGESTAISGNSQAVFLESACFAPAAVAGTGRRYKRHTDALHRFERGVDPTLQVAALERATRLICEIAGGQAGPITRVESPQSGQREAVELRHAQIGRLLGTQVAAEEVTDILQRLGMQVEVLDGAWSVTPPGFRFDINMEADLIEEIARIHGYDNLPAREREVRADLAPRPEALLVRDHLRNALLQRGYFEAISYSFVSPELQHRLNPDVDGIDVDNPISEQMSQMRTTLWSSLLPVWIYNSRRQARRIRLFEFGLRFQRDPDQPVNIAQTMTCAGIVGGYAYPEHWDGGPRNVDFYDVKGDMQALFELSGQADQFSFEAARHPALHPGRSALIRRGETVVGWLGQLHPGIDKNIKNKELPYLFELDYKSLSQAHVPRVQAVSEFPSVRRDLALVIDESLPVGTVTDYLGQQKVEHLQSVTIFDVFRGQDLETGFKSVALGLIFQDKTSTLTDEAVDDVVARLAARLGERFGAKIRGQ